MVQARADRRRAIAFALLSSMSALVLAGVGSRPANADVTTVSGSAFGASAEGTLNTSPFTLAPVPTVTLPSTGATPPLTATAASANLSPILETGTLNASTEGTLGPEGSSTSSASAEGVFLGPLNDWTLSSTCTATETALTGSTTVTGGVIVLIDPEDDISGEPGEVTQTVPVNPPPNTTYQGQIANTTDNFTVIFNEQVVGANSIVVNAMHMELMGPIAVGDVTIGHSECGVNTPTTTTTSSTTTTAPARVVDQPLARTGTGLGGPTRIAGALLALGLGAWLIGSQPRRARRR